LPLLKLQPSYYR